MKNWPILKKYLLIIVTACITCNYGFCPNIKNSAPTLLFALFAFLNGMTWAGRAHDHGGDRLKGKGLDAGQVQPSGDWALVLPTQELVMTSLLSPEILFKLV